MKMNFYVDENVLVPRFDTETLVEEVIKRGIEEGKKEILELCTGSGIIAITLAKNIENAKIIATDISKGAINIAKKNAKNLCQTEKIEFVQSDMFENVKRKFDIIVSNPPYIKTEVIKEYRLEHEPQIALDGGKDGLDFYRIIIEQGHNYLKNGGIIALEIGYDQRKEVIALANKCGNYIDVECIKDLAGNDRVIVMRKN